MNLNLGGIFSQGIFLCHDASVNPCVIRGSRWEDAGLSINTTYWPLPVELVNFTGKVVGNRILLEWQTETEICNYGFEVEKKIDNQWNKIGFAVGYGNSNIPHNYEFTDMNILAHNDYRLKQIDTDGKQGFSAEIEIIVRPDEYKLYNNYPNPFNPSTVIKYQIPEAGHVTIKVYDFLGSEVVTLVNDEKPAGIYEVEFEGTNLASGLYLYKLETADYAETKKMILLR